MVKVDIKYEHLRPMLSNVLGYGIGRWVGREYQLRFGRRISNLGEYGGLTLTVVGATAQMIRDFEYEEDVRRISAGFALAGLDDLISVKVYDEVLAWFTDQNTLKVRNLGAFTSDRTKWRVIVDGNSVDIASVEGSTGEATIHLATTVSRGKHDVVIMLDGAKKAFSGKLYVP
jgi:hypothetical protein